MTAKRPWSHGSISAIPVYPIAAAALFVLDTWRRSSLDLPPVARPLVVALLLAALLTTLAAFATREVHLGGAVAGILVLGLIGGDDLSALVLSIVAALLIVVSARRAATLGRTIPWSKITGTLNVFALSLLLLVCAPVGVTLATSVRPAATSPDLATSAAGAVPNIVVILLDGHGRQDVLAAQYGEDISGFVEALSARGFYVSPSSRSNYMTTQLTLASMFNFNHVLDLGLPHATDPGYLVSLRARIEGNRAFAVLRSVGYRVGAVASGWEGTSLRSADQFVDGGQLTELEGVLMVNSAASRLVDVVSPELFNDFVRSRVTWNLDPTNWLPGLADGVSDLEPYFTFVHVLSPHPPYLFERDGDPIPDDAVVARHGQPGEVSPQHRQALADAYSAQLAYVDALTIAALDKVIATVPEDAVIVVMSDHGPDVHMDWNNLDPVTSRERFANFFAARTPGHDQLFGEAPTPVNLLPTLLNAYAGTDIALEPDSSFLGRPPYGELVDIGDPDRDTR